MHDSVPPRAAAVNCASPQQINDAFAPVASPLSTGMALPAAFRQYVEQHRAYAEHTRHAHEQERELWHLERVQLLERIKELEQAVMLLGGNIDDPLRAGESRGLPARSDLSHRARPANGMTGGSEYWKGAGGSGATQPTRAFSEPSNTSHPTIIRPHHLPSIHETTLNRKKSVGFDMGHTGSMEKDFHVHPIPSIALAAGGNSFDSITFKSSVLSSVGTSHRSSGTQSPSPLHTPQNPPGPREPKPQLLHLPSSGLTSSDLLVKDAGHTPLARLTDPASVSSQGTPLRPEETQFKPPEKAVRPPTERSDSYFPVATEATESNATQDDPELKGPLGLGTHQNTTENDSFLDAVDSKLRQAQQADSSTEAGNEPEVQPSGETLHPKGDSSAEGGLEPEEPEPELRIRSSTNFGSAFGASALGKGI